MKKRGTNAFDDTFTTTKLGSLFMMRLAAFVSERQARVIDVDERYACLEIGGRSVSDWFFGRDYIERTRIDMTFIPARQTSVSDPTQRLSVSVSVRPARVGSSEFETLATYLIRDLRGYFAAV